MATVPVKPTVVREAELATPNLDKARDVRDISEAQGALIEWMRFEKGLVICKNQHFNYDRATRDYLAVDPETNEDAEGDEHDECTSQCGWLPFVNGETDIRKLLAAYHDIDYDEMLEEQERVFQAVRAAADTRRVGEPKDLVVALRESARTGKPVQYNAEEER
jgi:hypothetical protein